MLYSLVLEVLDAPEAFEVAVDHDGQSSTEGLTLFHADSVCVCICGMCVCVHVCVWYGCACINVELQVSD